MRPDPRVRTPLFECSGSRGSPSRAGVTSARALFNAMLKSSTRKNRRSPLPGDASSGLIKEGCPCTPPLMEAEQHGPIRVQDLTKVVMARRRLGLAEERLVPFEAAGHVAYADDCPCAFYRISTDGLTSLVCLSPTCRAVE